jgi:hypothetical protein
MTNYFQINKETAILLVTAIVVGTSIAFATETSIVPVLANDPLLTYLQAAGFPAWAGLVAWATVKITNEVQNFTAKLDAHIENTNRRLVIIEQKFFDNEKGV